MRNRKQDILDTATRLFSKFGYRSIGTDRVIKESGVAKMTLFRNFPSKDDLIFEVLDLRRKESLNGIEEALKFESKPINKLKCIFLWHDSWFNSVDFSGCMFVGAISEFKSESKKIIGLVDKYKLQLTEIIKEILESDIEPLILDKVSRQIVIILDGAIILASTIDKENAINDAWDIVLSLLAPVCSSDFLFIGDN